MMRRGEWVQPSPRSSAFTSPAAVLGPSQRVAHAVEAFPRSDRGDSPGVGEFLPEQRCNFGGAQRRRRVLFATSTEKQRRTSVLLLPVPTAISFHGGASTAAGALSSTWFRRVRPLSPKLRRRSRKQKARRENARGATTTCSATGSTRSFGWRQTPLTLQLPLKCDACESWLLPWTSSP